VHVCFAPKAPIADQNVIRRYMPIATECSAATALYSITLSARANTIAWLEALLFVDRAYRANIGDPMSPRT
jgi:hypothetical protein